LTIWIDPDTHKYVTHVMNPLGETEVSCEDLISGITEDLDIPANWLQSIPLSRLVPNRDGLLWADAEGLTVIAAKVQDCFPNLHRKGE
jgi:hypothetical protein